MTRQRLPLPHRTSARKILSLDRDDPPAVAVAAPDVGPEDSLARQETQVIVHGPRAVCYRARLPTPKETQVIVHGPRAVCYRARLPTPKETQVIVHGPRDGPIQWWLIVWPGGCGQSWLPSRPDSVVAHRLAGWLWPIMASVTARFSGGSSSGRVMGGVVIWGRVKPVRLMGSMVSGGVVMGGVVIWGRVKPVRLMGSMVSGGVVMGGSGNAKVMVQARSTPARCRNQASGNAKVMVQARSTPARCRNQASGNAKVMVQARSGSARDAGHGGPF